MDPDRKPRSDSQLDSLPESRIEELKNRLFANESHRVIKEWLALDCGVIVRSGSALTAFYQRHCAPEVRERRALAAVKAEAIVDEAGRTDWNAATLELVKQISFEIISGQQVDFKTAEKFVKLVLKADDQGLDREKFEEAKRQRDAAKDVAGNDSLTPEEKAARLKSIFGMG